MKAKKNFNISTYLLALVSILDCCLASQATTPAAGSTQPAWMELIKFAPFIILFYYMLYYQPKKREKEHKALVDALQPGQKVLLNNGMYGSIISISPTEEIAKVEIADNVIISVLKSVISSSTK